MKWRVFLSEVDPHEEFYEQIAAARTPYAEAWKEFDKLQANAKGRGAKWVHFVLSNIFVLFGGGAFGLAVFKKHYSYVVATFFGLIISGLYT